MLVLVPPTSKNTPSETRRYIKAPATVAEGPESMVRIGRLRISTTSITPPSPRMIMSGASIPAFRTLASVMFAVSSILGRMPALMTAVRVRVVRPYSFVISCPPVAGTPNSFAAAMTSSSFSGVSTLKASLATITLAPRSNSDWIALRAWSAVSLSVLRKAWKVSRTRPVTSGIVPTAVWLLASMPPIPVPIPMMPTGARSPSSRALVAWVVLWARNTTARGSMPNSASARWKTVITPLATPSPAAWVVRTETLPMISSVSLSRTTALVKVPPTSMPMRTVRGVMGYPRRLLKKTYLVARRVPIADGVPPCI